MTGIRTELWTDWIERTLWADVRSPDAPDPVAIFDDGGDQVTTTDTFDSYRYGRGDGQYLYMLYQLDEPAEGPADVVPVYIGETNRVTSRLLDHAKKIRSSLPISDWEDDGSWGSWSKYDHMAGVYDRSERPLCAWICDVDDLDTGPYGVPTYRQELEAKLVGLVHAQPRFERVFANREFVPNRVVHHMGQVGHAWMTGAAQDYSPTDLVETGTPALGGRTKADLWREWVEATILKDIRDPGVADPIPLFETTGDLQVSVEDGILQRSAAIDERIRREGKRCIHETGVTDGKPEGLLYVLYQLDRTGGDLVPTDLVPRYVGKAEAYGKKNELSANFTEIARDRNTTGSFARWGDGDYWHVGELSNTVFGRGNKKHAWACELFEPGSRQLQQQTYLWIKAWDPAKYRGPYGISSYLAEAEALLIGLAYAAYPGELLNHDGVPDTAPVKEADYSFGPAVE